MSLRNIFSSLAPMAVGAMFPAGIPALAAGAATGAAIAKANNEDVFTSAAMGGLGGYSGGNLGAGFRDMAAKKAVGNLTAPATLYDKGAVMGGFNPSTTMGPLGATQGAVGTTTGSSFAQGSRGLGGLTEGIKAAATSPTNFLKSMGGGDALKGGIKTTAALAPGVAGAMVPDMTTAEENQIANYDPNRRLNLNRDTGLRLLNEGGYLPYEFSDSTTMDPERFRMFMMQREMREPSRDVVYDEGLQAIENERARVMRDPQVVENERARVLRRIDPNVGIEKENLDRYNALMERLESRRQSIKNMPEGPEKEEIMRMNDNFSRDEFYYNQGGYLDEGVGDGMSDEIMGDIDGTQPVRLSEGEFVVPADVVSHLGNGDSDSGAEQLYAMMDRVRKARTGNEKQGKEIKAERLMPA
jgi:hypothetical protein